MKTVLNYITAMALAGGVASTFIFLNIAFPTKSNIFIFLGGWFASAIYYSVLKFFNEYDKRNSI